MARGKEQIKTDEDLEQEARELRRSRLKAEASALNLSPQEAVARSVAVELVTEYFNRGVYRSPEDLKEHVAQLKENHVFEEVHLDLVTSYLAGVLDSRDIFSPLHNEFPSFDRGETERSSRQALTTLTALREEQGIDKI